MSRNIVKTDAAPTTPIYSQAVKAAGLVFVSGQTGTDPATGELAGPTIQEQTRQSLKNISAILDAAGSSLEKVVSATWILTDSADFDGMNEEWQAWFPTDPPARQGTKFPLDEPGMRISIAAIAEL
jgi:2-iminobutanoate/2-iminopropanoate deaminase